MPDSTISRRTFLTAHSAPLTCAACGEPINKLSGKEGDCLVVHHKDGDRTNNSLDNLESVHGACHRRRHNLQGGGFTGKRHNAGSKTLMGHGRGGGKPCPPGCTCKRHLNGYKGGMNGREERIPVVGRS